MNTQPIYNFTGREKTCLRLISQGLGNKEIARLQGCSPNTVKARVSTILYKLCAKNRAEAISQGYKRGLLHSIALCLVLISQFTGDDDQMLRVRTNRMRHQPARMRLREEM